MSVWRECNQVIIANIIWTKLTNDTLFEVRMENAVLLNTNSKINDRLSRIEKMKAAGRIPD